MKYGRFNHTHSQAGLVALLCLLFALNVSSQERDFLDLSLEELMNIKVVTASKRLEDQESAPAVMQVISRTDIRHYGARNLVDVLDRATNLQVVGSNLYPHNRVAIRGVMQTHIDNKILFLINGRPLRDALQGGKNMDLYMGLPVSAIERIEIIRGPGSVIYGTNAFSGVINVVTLKGKTANEASVSQGSFGYQQIDGVFTRSTEDYDSLLAVNHISKDGDEFEGITDENGAEDTLTTAGETSQGLVYLKHGGWEVNLYASDNTTDHTNSVFTFPNNEYEVSREFVDVGYSLDLSNKWSLQFNGTLHQQKDEFFIINDTIGGADSLGKMAQVTAQYSGANYHWLLGAEYETLESKLNRSGNSYDTHNSGIYSQWDQSFGSSYKLVAGIQANKSEFADWDYSPRLGLIYTIDNDSGLKLLYGRAFRMPFILDLFVDSPALRGNPDLKPEKIETVDLEYFRHGTNSSLSLVLYYSEQKDIHSRFNVGGFTNSFQNKGEVSYQGVEFSGHYQLNPIHRAVLNASYQENENDSGMENTTFSPNEMFKTGLQSHWQNSWHTGVFANYFGEPTQLSDINADTQNVNPKASAYTLVTVNVTYQMMQNRYGLNGLELGFFIDNLLDEEIYFPSYSRQGVNSLPHHASRNYTLTLRAQF